MIDTIHRWLQSNGTEPPLLIVANEKYDWDILLRTVCQLNACEKAASRPCGTCRPCVHAASWTHPDCTMVRHQDGSITISDIRSIKPLLHRSSFRERQLFIIHHAERMLREASNALLKELEEPAPTTRFLLTTSFIRRLLPTITSRCQVMRISGLTSATHELATKGDNTFEHIVEQTPRQELTDRDLQVITQYLTLNLQKKGPGTATYRSLLRLRDYYKIRAQKGNVKLAEDILIATLSQLHKNTRT